MFVREREREREKKREREREKERTRENDNPMLGGWVGSPHPMLVGWAGGSKPMLGECTGADRDALRQPLKPPRIISGRLVVIGMFLLGVLGGTICVTYAIWRNAPYHDLTKALAAEFPKSVPKVEGGQNKGSPRTLRIVLNVAFPPVRKKTLRKPRLRSSG